MLHRFIVVALTVAVLVSVQVVGADSIADHVVISEIEIKDSEWVELYNPTGSDVDMSSWYWCYFASGKNWNESSNKKAFSACSVDLTIETHTFYLMRIDGTVSGADWDTGYLDVPGTLSNTGGGSVGIFPWDPSTKTPEEAESGRIDAIGWGSVSYVKEGFEAGVPDSGESLQRKVNATINYQYPYGPAWDSDDNSADFFVSDPNPTNSTISSADPAYPVPELSTLVLFSTGLLTLAGYRWLLKIRRRV